MKKSSVFLGLVATAFLSQNQANAASIIGLTNNNALVSFDSSTPGTITSNVNITNLQAGETVRAIDFRPSDKLLYGLGVLGTTGTVYRINSATGAATSIISIPTLDVGGGGGAPLGFDFNPVSDALRIVTNNEQNLRITSNLSIVNVDGDLNPGNPNIVGAGYTNNFAGTTSTRLFVIDAGGGSGESQLLTQGSSGVNPVSPNTGTLFNIGSLGVNSGGRVGFDITSDNQAFASLTVPSGPDVGGGLYSINLNTGAATLIGAISGNPIQGIAVVPSAVPEPNSFGLLSVGLLGLVGYGWRRLKSSCCKF